MSTRRVATAIALTLLLPFALPLVPTVAAQGDDIRALAVYDDFSVVPVDGYFQERGLAAGYRFASIPAIIVAGPAASIEDLRGDPALAQIVHDEPVEFHLETAVVASKARDVWGDIWHASSGVDPLLKEGLPIDGRGVTVGVVDSGVNALHPDLWYAPLALVDGVTPAPKVKECVHTTGIVGPVVVATPDCDEQNGHGTHVAGIVAGTGMMADMGFTVSGIADYNGAAPGAQLVAAGLGVETVAAGGLVIDALAGLDYMYNNADRFGIRVVTNSWSSTSYNCNYSPGIWKNDGDVYHAITNKMVLDKGITVLWAANNGGGTRPLGTSPQSRNTMPGVISVSNYDDKGTGTRDGDVAGSSGDGCVKTGGAPEDLVWTWPDVAAPGTNIVSTAAGVDGVLGQAPIFVGSSPSDAPFYTTLTGTSMATPHVAGVVALMYQAYPDITPAQVESILIQTAKPWADGVSARGVAGTQPYWGPTAVNNAVAGFADTEQCRITRSIAARAEANDASLDALFPGFRELVQPRVVNGHLVDVDAANYVCRDFKRGAGLIDAHAAVLEALRLAGDDPTGTPEVKIQSPSAGATVSDALLDVSGLVDRDGDAPNTPPIATLAASATGGPAPLTVDFSLAAADDDGTIVSFTLDFGDGSAPLSGASLPTSTQSHTYGTEGSYTATLTVTDDDGASADDSVTILVGGLPTTNPGVTGGLYAYNYVVEIPGVVNLCPGPSNVVALAQNLVTESNEPPMYPAGTTVCLQARSVASTDVNVPVTTSSTGTVRIFDAEGNVVWGPVATPAFDDSDALGNERVGFDGPNVEIPVDWSGRYWLAFAVDTADGPVYITDSTYGGLKPLEILGAGAPSVGSPGGNDDGHSIGDPDNDGTFPWTEIEWVDTSVDADFVTAIIKTTLVPAQPAGDSPFLYDFTINGVEFEAYIFGGFGVFDNTNGAVATGSSTTWDTATNTVTMKIARSYLTTIGADCPCTGFVAAMVGEGLAGGLVEMDRAPNAGSRDLRAGSLIPQPRASSQSDPDNTDPEGDVPLPHVDVTKVWVSRETASELDLTVEVADLSASPPSVDAGNPARASWSYGVDFCVDNAAATYTATGGNFAGVSGVVCYRLSAANGVLGIQHSGGGIQADGSGSCGITGLTKGVTFNTAASTVTFTVDISKLTVRTISAGVAQCSTTPQERDAPAPTTGSVLSRFSGRTGFSGPVVTAIIDDSVAANARPYTLGGGTGDPLVAEAGSGYTGGVGDSITIVGTAVGGTAPYSCAWTSSEGTFTDAGACTTSVVFASAGLKGITLTVTDDAGDSAVDTATVEVLSDEFERVEVVVGGSRSASVPVTTSEASPSAPWSVTIDVAGLHGETQIVATWYEADGTVLATATRTVTIDLTTEVAFIDITSPAEGAEVHGVTTVTGEAGHTTSEGAAQGLNHYGLPIWSGMNGGRAATTLEGSILVPCAACQPGQLQKPVGAIPNAAWNPIANNLGPIANPLLFDNLGTSQAWVFGPDSDFQGFDGYWFDIAGRGGDEFELTDPFDVELDIRFFAQWEDLDQVGGKNGAAMPKTGIVPDAANWAFVYMRKGTTETAANQWGATPTLTLRPVIVPPGAVQALAATSGPGTVALTWAAPIADGGELLGYKVLRDGTLLNTVTAPGYVDEPGDTADHVYAVIPYNSAGDGPSTAVTAAAGPPSPGLAITSPIDGAVGVSPSATISGTYTPGSTGGGGGGSGAFANTHYVFLMNLNSPCGSELGYGDHVIASKLVDHARNALGVPANNIHVYNEGGVALTRSVDASLYDQLPTEWKTGAIFDGPARWSVFQPALRTIADTAAAGEAAGGAPARIFFLETSHGLQAPLILGDGVTDSVFCLWDGDVSSTELGDLLNDIDADVEAAHDVTIEWAIAIDCSFCGGFVDSPLPAPSTSAAFSAGVVGPNRVVEVGCAWVTECFGNPAVTYDHMFNHCVFTNKADGYGPVLTTFPGTGLDGSDIAYEVLVGNPSYATPDGVITFEEAYWCALESAHTTMDPIAVQQMFQISDNLVGDMFLLEGFPLWEKDSSIDLSQQDPAQALDTSGLHLPDVRVTDPTGDATTPFSDLTGVEARATDTDIHVDLSVADLTISSLEAEDVVQYEIYVNDHRYAACYMMGSVLLWGDDIPSEDPVTGEPTTGDVSAGEAVYDTANGVIHFRIPRFELTNNGLPATVYGVATLGDCNFDGLVEDDRVPDSGHVLTSDDPTPPPPPAEKITVALSGPANVEGDATLDAAAGTWTFDPPGDLAQGHWTATATRYLDSGSGYVQQGSPVAIGFTVGLGGDIEPPTAPGTPTRVSATTSSITLAWTASTDNVGVDHYEVLRNGASVGLPTSNGFTDTGLAAGTAYTYVVKAFDAAGNSATSGELVASTETAPPVVATVTLRVGTTELARVSIDHASAGDPATWTAEIDLSGFEPGEIVLTADYEDGEGGSASDSVRLVVTSGLDIEITSPLEGENVRPTFTVAGATQGTGGPQGAQASFLFPDGTLDALDPAYMLATTTDVLEDVDAAFAGTEGYLGAGPALDGLVVQAYFAGTAPEAPEGLVPAPWRLETVGDVELSRAMNVFQGELPLMRAREGPPAPALAVGMGPGSHLLMTMKYAPGYTFACTANFVWKDAAGDYYLGAAGHCFLPSPIAGGPQGDAVSTHGPGADYDPKDTTVRVCVANCIFGGQSGFLVRGTMVTLGNPAYARQTGPGGDVGNDFGIVKIPESLYDLVRPEMAVWNGPTSEGTLTTGEPVLLYGNAVGFGETFPTKARGGLAGVSHTASRWSAFLPSMQGDSGSALVSAAVTGDTQVVEGRKAVGVLTHLVLGTAGPVAGTTMARSKAMAAEAGLAIEPVYEGATIAPPVPTVPGAPTLETLSPDSDEMGLTWLPPTSDGNSPITGYTIRYGTTAGTYTQTKTVGAVTSATVTGLLPSTTYHFVVAATNAQGTGPDSNERSATTLPAPTVPGAPGNVGAVPGSREVTVGWDAPGSDGGEPIEHYTVYWTGDGSGYLSVAASERLATITGLTNGVEYAFSVTATNSVGEGPHSAEARATPDGNPPPGVTVEVRADAGGAEVLAWTAADDYDGSTFFHEIANAPGGDLTVTARLLKDGVPVATRTVDVWVLSPPEISVPAQVEGSERELVTFTATATDPDGPGGLAFSLVAAPEGATIGSASGEFRWTPDHGDEGLHQVTVRVTDPEGLTDEASLWLAIDAANRPPVLVPIGNKQVSEGATLSFDLSATDHENDPLTFAADPLPAGASFSGQTFTWTPAFGQDGNYEVTFSVTDGLASDEETITITVGNVNRPPVLDPIGPRTGVEDSLLTFTVTGSDPDTSDTLTFSATDLPAGATFVGGVFAWTPSFTSAGDHVVTFRVSDGDLTDSEVVVITIADLDRAPRLDPVATGSVKQLSQLTIPLKATDPDGDAIRWAVNGPGATIEDLGNGNARLRWTPTLDQLGPHTFTVFVTAGELSDSKTTVLTALFKADLTATPVGLTNVKASPGDVLTFVTTVTNTGPQTDTFRISAANDRGLAVTGIPAPITLAPGASAEVSVKVTMSASNPITWTTVTATSLGDGALSKSVKFRSDIPVVVDVTIDETEEGADLPSGSVHVTYLNGEDAKGAQVSVMQTPKAFGPTLRNTKTGTTDANGTMEYDFTLSSGGAAPGAHSLYVTAKLPGGSETVVSTEYVILVDIG